MEFRVKGIKKVVAKGRAYYYHRATGVKIEEGWGTAAFLLEKERLDGMAMERQGTRLPGSVDAMAGKYIASVEWAGLKERTRQGYMWYLERLDWLGRMPVLGVRPKHIKRWRNEQHERSDFSVANHGVVVVKGLFRWGRGEGFVDDNPAIGIPAIKRPEGMAVRNRTWADWEFEAVMREASEGVKVALVLGRFTGLRREDLVRLPWSAYVDGQIDTTHGKTGAAFWMPAPKRLREMLDELERVATTIITSRFGRPYSTGDSLAKALKNVVDRMVKRGVVEPGLCFHGLRHTLATDLADRGADFQVIRSVTGHTSDRMVERYTANRDRRGHATAAAELLDDGNVDRTKLENRLGKLSGKNEP
jgi:integrase